MNEAAPSIPPRACAVSARVTAVVHPCREHVRIECAVMGFPPSHPGQFLQLLCRSMDDAQPRAVEWQNGDFPSLSGLGSARNSAYLRRPFSIADRWEVGDTTFLAVISRAVGPGTSWLDQLHPGESLNLSGPLGRGFQLPERTDRPVLLVGGGVGIPPLLYLCRRLQQAAYTDATLVIGALSHDLLPLELLEEPRRDGRATRSVRLPGGAAFPAIITTDDGTRGMPGQVTAGVDAWAAARPPCDPSPLVFACGPEGMLRAVAEQTRRLRFDCQLCIERNMGCGMGTCLSCVVRMRDTGRSGGWRWGLACQDGPVFDRDALV